MGPNAKKRSRKQYVNYRLRVLQELNIAPPSQVVIDKLMDENETSEVQVDAVFLQCIKNSKN